MLVCRAVPLVSRFCLLLESGDFLEFSAPNLESVIGHLKLQDARVVGALTQSDSPSGCIGVAVSKREEGKPERFACDKDDLPAFRDVWEPMMRSIVLGKFADKYALSEPVSPVAGFCWRPMWHTPQCPSPCDSCPCSAASVAWCLVSSGRCYCC